MFKQLSDDDRRAIDLMLNRMRQAEAGATVFAGSDGVVPQERLAAVQKVFALLDELPAEDPPEDLVARTLKRVNESKSMAEMVPPQLRAEPPPPNELV